MLAADAVSCMPYLHRALICIKRPPSRQTPAIEYGRLLTILGRGEGAV